MTNISKIIPPNCSHHDAICPSCGKIIGADADLCPYCRMFFLEEDINDIKDNKRLVCRKCGSKKIHIFEDKRDTFYTCLLCHSKHIGLSNVSTYKPKYEFAEDKYQSVQNNDDELGDKIGCIILLLISIAIFVFFCLV